MHYKCHVFRCFLFCIGKLFPARRITEVVLGKKWQEITEYVSILNDQADRAKAAHVQKLDHCLLLHYLLGRQHEAVVPTVLKTVNP